MTKDLVDIFRDFVHLGSLAALFAVILVALVSLIRPHYFKSVFKEFSKRRYIFGSMVFLGLLCGTISLATTAPDYSHQHQSTNSEQQLHGFIENQDTPTSNDTEVAQAENQNPQTSEQSDSAASNNGQTASQNHQNNQNNSGNSNNSSENSKANQGNQNENSNKNNSGNNANSHGESKSDECKPVLNIKPLSNLICLP